MNKHVANPKSGISYFLMVATGVFLSTMDSSMLNLALPHIMSSFSTTLARVEWVVLIYLLTIAVTLLIWGKYSDAVGKGSVYLIGMLVFSLGSMFCYFSPTLLSLIFFRFIQGMGAAMMMATGPAIIRLSVPRSHLGKWLGSLGIATSLGLMSGPLVAGFILHRFSWRTIFLLNVPISLFVFLLGWFFLAGTLPRYFARDRRIDIYGSLLWSAIITLVVLLLSGQVIDGLMGSATAAAALAVLAVLFFRHQTVCSNPLIPIGLLKRRYYSVAMITVLLSFAVLFFALILMPFFLKYIAELSFDRIGYVMMAVPVSLFVVSPLSGRLFDKIGARYLTVTGMTVAAGALVLLAGVDQHSTILDIAWRLALLGCGQSIFLSPNTASVLSRVSFEHTGISSGMLATSRNLGMLFGVALVGMIFSYFFQEFTGGSQLLDYSSEQLPQFLRAFRLSLYCAAAIACINAVLSFLRE